MATRAEREKLKKQKRMRRLWLAVRPAIVLGISLVIVFFIARFTVNYVLSNYINPVDSNDATPIEVTIPASSSASSIARILYGACGYDKEGLISSTAAFKVYVDFVGKANNLKAGTYVFSKNMSIKQIVEELCEGNAPKATITFTVPEGYTIVGIGKVLVEKGLISSEADLLTAAKTGSAFTNFAFINDVAASSTAANRAYVLEGYLFPDTYEVYADASVETILIKMLNRFNEVFTDDYLTRAQQLGMTMDQVVTLASLIEREAQAPDDFAKVSAVFHNRLSQDMPLQSCASLSYVLGVTKYVFNETERATDSLYNTYKYNGLPVGPVCNPGKAAIEAALYPNEDYLAGGYLYFCNQNPAETSELVFAKTYEEHQANVEKYQQYWG
ncbi:MAG TPA: endolytic transglycosylase MltG [Candidatus Cryosericum sp.]|nr:endolytic transglycosylase MltG [Candidatus Cryosericum sp.]